MKKSLNFLFGIALAFAFVVILIKKFDEQGLALKAKKITNKSEKKESNKTSDALSKIKPAVSKKSALPAGLTDRQEQIINIFSNNKTVSMDILLKEIKGVHVRTLRREMLKLSKMGLISKRGTTKGTIYERV